MKYLLPTLLLVLTSQTSFRQNLLNPPPPTPKGKFYVYWGWNRGWFTESDIQFQGTDYHFKLKNVVATDRQSEFNITPYFHPAKFTIPQYNFRIGYFLNNKYSVSIGTDHMNQLQIK